MAKIRTNFSNKELEVLHNVIGEQYVNIVNNNVQSELLVPEFTVKNNVALFKLTEPGSIKISDLIDASKNDYLRTIAMNYTNIPTEAVNLRLPSVQFSDSNGSLKIVYATE